jgi:hypothetical protein
MDFAFLYGSLGTSVIQIPVSMTVLFVFIFGHGLQSSVRRLIRYHELEVVKWLKEIYE